MDRPPRVIGVVNLTEDSFSDGGRYLEPQAAIARAEELMRDGADLIELGPASSHPDAQAVSPEQEIRRLEPVLDALSRAGVPLSVDSFLPETQRFALARGVAFLNDVRGFPHAELYPELAGCNARLVVMHSMAGIGRARREPADPDAALRSIDAFFGKRVERLVAAGVARERLVLDPGMGFFLASNPEPSVAALRALPELRVRFGLPLLVSVSRKSFLGALSGRAAAARGAATLAAELFAAARGVDFIRTHDVRPLRDALTVWRALDPSVGSGVR